MLNIKTTTCPSLAECMSNPAKTSCNIACPDVTENCYESYKVFTPDKFAKVSIPLQPYQNLFDMDAAFIAGTIFKDLYSPYSCVKFVED